MGREISFRQFLNKASAKCYTHSMPMESLSPKGQQAPPKQEVCVFAQTNYRNQMRRFGIKTDDRRRHMYVIGKTGMGKTTMMENMVLSDVYHGHGVGVVDPHGDFAEKLINYIPAHRINDVIYFNPSDMEYPIGFNILEVKSEEQKHLVAAGLMGIFKKLWPDVWSARMEYILNNTLLALLDFPGTTLLGINRMLADKKYRKKIVRNLKDPVVKAFWQNEFANYEDRYAKEAVAPIQNKIGQFLSASIIRNIVAQVKSTFNMREAMDSGKIIIMNLSKGRIGEDNSRLLGGMLITEIQLAAMERVDIPEEQRQDFFLYVDEFQNFATPSFANILSEARKYRLSLIMAHQYVAQLDEIVADAVFGNVGTIVTFRVGGADAELLVKEFEPLFMEQDIVNLAKYQVFLKLMIDGVASQPFSAMTLPPIGKATGSTDKVIRVSRERYAKIRSSIEDKIMRWSGMGVDEEEGEMDDDEDDELPPPRPKQGDGKRDTGGERKGSVQEAVKKEAPARETPRTEPQTQPQPRKETPPLQPAPKPVDERPFQPVPEPQFQPEPKNVSLHELPSRDAMRKQVHAAKEPTTPVVHARPETQTPAQPQGPSHGASLPHAAAGPGPAQTGEKRKRKRKRNRKKKSQAPSAPPRLQPDSHMPPPAPPRPTQEPQQPQPRKEAPPSQPTAKPAPEPQPQPKPAEQSIPKKSIDPEQIISFD